MNEQLATYSERLAGKALAQRFLVRMGLDSRQFVIFLGLFRTLSEREEFMSMVGVNRFSLSYIAIFTGVMGTVLWTGLAFGGVPAPLFLLINLLIAFVLIFPTIMREAANALFNPVEATMLAASPIHSLTYAAAKIAHVLITVFYMVIALTLPAALIGMALKGTRWFWPVTHLAAALLIGLTAAFLVCALYGWMTRVVPANWLKGVSMWIQVISFVAFPYILISFPVFWGKLLLDKSSISLWSWIPFTWFVNLGLLGCHGATWRLGWQGALSIAVTTLIAWLGLRSFAGTYFSEASSMAQDSSRRNRKRNALPRGFAALVRAVTGSPVGLGAFGFVSKMMRRDWQFRRNILTQTLCLPLFAMLILIIAGSGSSPSPLARNGFSYAHLIPHLLGMISMTLCSMIPFTDFHNGSWIYLTEPIGNLQAFARGVYCALWIPAAGMPHLIALPFLARLWGWKEAALLAGFSLIIVSLYLAFELNHIPGLPFSSPFDEWRVTSSGQDQFYWILVIMIAVTIQCALFRFWWIALLAGIVLAVLTWLVLRLTLRGLEEEFRWRLHIMKTGPNQMFKEVG
jgi:hypothetical protein